jgi:phage tail-like protein
MAIINNPRKLFQFTVIIPGINPFTCQQVKTPDIELDTDEHGETNHTIKTAGQVKYGMLSVQKISDAIGLDNYIWSWIQRIQDPSRGGGDLPIAYKIPISIEQYSNDGVTVIKRWVYAGCWPKRINGIEFNRAQSGNTVESIEFEVDKLISA